MQAGWQWLPQEADFHINCLEFKAALFALQTFATRLVGEHFRLLIDSTTAGSCTNHIDTSRDSHHCNEKPSAFRNLFVGSPHPWDQRVSSVSTPPWEIKRHCSRTTKRLAQRRCGSLGGAALVNTGVVASATQPADAEPVPLVPR